MAQRKPGLSLKSRGKKKIGSLNAFVRQQLAKAPIDFLTNRIERMIRQKAPNASEAFPIALAKHLIERDGEPFEWDEDPNPLEGKFTITDDDLRPLIEEAMDFARNKPPHIVPKLPASSASVVLKSLERDWPNQRAHELAQMAQFKSNLEERWGSAFDTLRMMYTITVELGGEIATAQRRGRAKKNRVLRDTLIHFHARGCQVVLEIITLLENGLADGAMARWRTLHEICVVANVINEHGEEIATRYRAHEVVEAKRAMDGYVKHHEAFGFKPPTPSEIELTDKDYEAAHAFYGHGFGSEYGWAAKHLKQKKPRFIDLEQAAGQSAMNSYYRMASYNVHASVKGIAFRHGLMAGKGAPIALAGASNAGFIDPAQNSASDLVHLQALLITGTARFDRMVELSVLMKLRDALSNKLRRAQMELERAHRAQMKMERAHAEAKPAKAQTRRSQP